MSLRIIKAEFFLVQIPLTVSVDHALAKRKINTAGFVVLTATDGALGIGEFLNREYVTGETLEDCLHYLKQTGPLLTQSNIDNPIPWLQSVRDNNADSPGKFAAFCAIELALLDLWSKSKGASIAEVIYPNKPQTNKDLLYSAVYPFAKGAKLFVLNLFFSKWMRFQHVKIKGTGDIEKDLNYVEQIRRSFSEGAQIRLDLNGSLSSDHADEYFSRMLKSKARVTWFEQPFPKEAWDLSKRFQKQFENEAVFCADESACSLEDLDRIILEGAFMAINIRIGKNGGILNSLKLYQRAVGAGIATQLGCLVGESSVLSYAGLHFAVLADELRYREGCFGKMLVKWDVINPSLSFSRGGRVSPNKLPKSGLVPSFDVEGLRRQSFQTGEIGGKS